MAGDPSLVPKDEPPRWVRIWFPLMVRIAVTMIALRFALVAEDPAAFLAYCGAALGASGWEIARWVK